MENWDFKSDSVQAYWNELENQLVNIIDELAPLVEFTNGLLLDNSTANVIFGQTQNLRFTVLLFGQLNKVFGLLYWVILQSKIWSSFLDHLN